MMKTHKIKHCRVVIDAESIKIKKWSIHNWHAQLISRTEYQPSWEFYLLSISTAAASSATRLSLAIPEYFELSPICSRSAGTRKPLPPLYLPVFAQLVSTLFVLKRLFTLFIILIILGGLTSGYYSRILRSLI